jgi:hypothetical protein
MSEHRATRFDTGAQGNWLGRILEPLRQLLGAPSPLSGRLTTIPPAPRATSGESIVQRTPAGDVYRL